MNPEPRERSHLFFGAKFLSVGVVNTVVGLLIIYASKWLLGLSDALANAAGYGVGVCVSFMLNRKWTFRDGGAFSPALLRFILVFSIAYPINLLCVLYMIRQLGFNSYLAQALGTPPYTITFYLANRYFVFRKIYK